MRPKRPGKPGQTPENSSPSKHSSKGGGSALGAAIAGYPDASSATPDNVEGPDSGSGEGTTSVGSPIVAKPTFLQNWLNPSLGQGYANYLYNVNPNNQAAYQRQQLEGQQGIQKVQTEGGEQRKTGSAATDNAIREATAKHTLEMADRFGISPDKLGDFQNATYNFIKQAGVASAGTSANVSGAQQNATKTDKYQRSTDIGMNAGAQMDAGKLASLTKQEAGPGQSSTMFSDLATAPFRLGGPTSIGNTTSVTTRGPASPQYPNGIPMGGSSTTTGQQFGGESMSQPQISNSSGGDAYSDYLAATGGSPSAQPAPAVNAGVTSPVNTKPAPVVQSQQPGMLSTLLDALKPYLQQNGGITNPVTTRYGGY